MNINQHNDSISTNSNSAISTSLEAKIQNVAATLRQKRDEAHRTQQLALERLRLVRQEADALEATVKDLQSKLETVQNQAGGSARAKDELEKLYKDVDMLSKEVSFQHQELISKRSKTEEKQEKMKESETKYESVRSNLERTIRERRMKLVKEKQQLQKDMETDDFDNDRNYNQENIGSSMEQHRVVREQHLRSENRIALKDLLDLDDQQRLLSKWPEVIQSKTAMIRTKAEVVRRRNTTLEMIVSQYMNQEQHNQQQQSTSPIVRTRTSDGSETWESTNNSIYPSLVDTDTVDSIELDVHMQI